MNWKQPNRVILQGIAEPMVSHYAARMKAYGTAIVAGISAGQGGGEIEQIPVFDLVEDAIEQLGEVEATLIFDPPYQVLDAALEAIAAGIRQVIVLSAGVPPLDVAQLLSHAQKTNTLLLGPGSNGIFIPDRVCLGTFNTPCYKAGSVGIVGRSSHMCDEVALALNRAGIGQSLVVSLGRDRIVGSGFQQWLPILEADDTTKAIVLIVKSDNAQEEAAAYYLNSQRTKPVIAYLAGLRAPREKIFLNAATIIANQLSYSVAFTKTERQTVTAFKEAGIEMAKKPSELPKFLNKVLSKTEKK
ncbi:CoA-binding protein [Pleurocapsales cyanobacterium LEGE 06147]|nr:CoA-binding protein [Pleurocapsales cyanobacterium LEGE 06147]